MPKTKKPVAKKEVKKVVKPTEEIKGVPLLDDEEKEVDPELIAGVATEEDEDADDIDALDDDEVDPFKDKWEE